jgi:hypothetical protein
MRSSSSGSCSRRFGTASVPSVALVLGCAAALVCSQSSELNAQTVRLRTRASLSLPTRIAIQNQVLHVRQKVGVTVGARMTVTFTPRFDVVTGVSYVPGYAVFHGAGNRIDVATSSHLLTGSTGARYWLLPPARKLSWEVHTGFGVVFGGRPAYEDLFESSTLSGVLGTTLRYRVGHIVTLKLRVQERLYRVHFGSGEPRSSKRPFQVSSGLEFPFLESRR